MAKVAERLLLLNDACAGLMARCHHLLMSFKRPAVLDSNMDKICQKFVKKFPEFQANAIEKGPSFNYFKQHAGDIHDALAPYYYTLVDVCQFKEETTKLLNDVATDILDLQFDIVRDLTIWFMDLLTSLTQLLLLVDSLQDRKDFCIIFAHAYNCTQSTFEPSYQKVSKFLIDYANPIRQLQEDCEQLSHRVGHILLAMGHRFSENGQLAVIREKGYLSIFDNPDQLTRPASSDVYFELQLLGRFCLWVLYGFLVCPTELQNDDTRDILRLALQHGLVVSIFRNVTFCIHDQYDALLVSPFAKKLKLPKLKELTKAARLHAVNESVSEHADARRFLRAQASVLCSLLHEVPGLVAPKLPIVLAILSLCRQEIMWYFNHLCARQPLARDWKKWTTEESFEDDYISELFFLVDQLSGLVATHDDVIKAYYVESFRTSMAGTVQLVEELAKDIRASAHGRLLLQSLSVADVATDSESLQGLRMNCYRLSAMLISAQGGSRTAAAKNLVVHLNTVCFRSRCIDGLPAQLRQFASLADLFYFTNEVTESFVRSLHCRGHIPRYCFSFVSLYFSAKQNLHRLCPEEQPTIATESVALAEKNLQAICAHVGNAFRVLYADMLQLYAMGGCPAGRTTGLPEGSPFYQIARRIEYTRQICGNICSAFRDNQTIQVYDQQLWPGQYLVAALKAALKEVLRGAATSNGKFERPTKFLIKCKLILRAVQEVQAHIDIGMESLLKEVLFEEFSDVTMGPSQAPGRVNPVSKLASSDMDMKTCGGLFLRFFSSGFVKWVSQGQLVYSDTSMAFLSNTRCLNDKGHQASTTTTDSASLLAHDYLEINELQAFCQFAGAHGVRALESRLLSQVQESALEIKRCLSNNSATLLKVSRRMAQPTAWLEAVKKLTGLDDLFRHAVLIGSILKLRRILYHALQQTLQSRIPFLKSAVQQVRRFEEWNVDPGQPAPGEQTMQYLAHEMGCAFKADGNENDLNLQNALRQLKLNAEDDSLWSLMPCLFGLHFICESWSSAVFDLSLSAHSNNGHCIAECVRALTCAFQHLPIENESLSVEDVSLRIKDQLSAFLRFASYSVFHMKQREAAFPSHHLPSIRLFIRYFVTTAGSLELSQLEDTLPYSVLRTDSSQLNDAQMVSIHTALDEKEDE
ncbi:CYRIA/CYRIB Rac1 binding domain-containing protein [Plasmodiophora brassicae]